MRFERAFILACFFVSTPALAFVGFIPKGFHGARKHNHVESEIFDEVESGVSKASVRRAIAPARHLRRHLGMVKRGNDFEVDVAAKPTAPQTAGLDQDGTDFSYFCEVKVGTNPGKTLYLLMDTGSASSWVMGSSCSDRACKSHSTFAPSDSSTTNSSSDKFSLSYPSGEVSGSIISDSIGLAGLNLSMTLGLADAVSDDFDDFPIDGILGLARSSEGSGMNAPTFFSTLEKDYPGKPGAIGVDLARASDGPNNGQITFGGIDSSRFEGELNYVDTVDKGTDWQIPIDNVLINGKKVSFAGPRTAILDTGTSWIFVPEQDAASLYSQIPGAVNSTASTWHIPCDTKVSISMVFNNVPYNISPKDYVGEKEADGFCLSTIIGRPIIDDTTFLVGATFLKNVYAVFDADKSRIGVAAKKSTMNSFTSHNSSSSTGSATETAIAGSKPTDLAPLIPSTSANSTNPSSPSLTPTAASGASTASSAASLRSHDPYGSSLISLIASTVFVAAFS